MGPLGVSLRVTAIYLRCLNLRKGIEYVVIVVIVLNLHVNRLPI
jgi:hypothetical protein